MTNIGDIINPGQPIPDDVLEVVERGKCGDAYTWWRGNGDAWHCGDRNDYHNDYCAAPRTALNGKLLVTAVRPSDLKADLVAILEEAERDALAVGVVEALNTLLDRLRTLLA